MEDKRYIVAATWVPSIESTRAWRGIGEKPLERKLGVSAVDDRRASLDAIHVRTISRIAIRGQVIGYVIEPVPFFAFDVFDSHAVVTPIAPQQCRAVKMIYTRHGIRHGDSCNGPNHRIIIYGSGFLFHVTQKDIVFCFTCDRSLFMHQICVYLMRCRLNRSLMTFLTLHLSVRLGCRYINALYKNISYTPHCGNLFRHYLAFL